MRDCISTLCIYADTLYRYLQVSVEGLYAQNPKPYINLKSHIVFIVEFSFWGSRIGS